MSDSPTKKENKPPSGRPPQMPSQPAPPGLFERPRHEGNILSSAPSATTTPGVKPGASTKSQLSSHGDSTSQTAPVDEQSQVQYYEQPTDGSRIQLVKLSPSDPDYEQPMDMSIPAHWVSWRRTDWNGDNDFTKAVRRIRNEYNTMRKLISPVLRGGVIAYQALHPATNEMSEPYLEVQLFDDDMGRWREALPLIQNLVLKHIQPEFQHVRIRFNFPEGVGFSNSQATSTADKSSPPKVYTPRMRQKHKPGADASLLTPESLIKHYGSGPRPKTTAERSEAVIWREEKPCNIPKTTAVGMSIGVKDGRVIDPQFGSGSCGPKFKLKIVGTGEYEKYGDGTDAYFVTSAHHAMHPKGDRLPALPDQMGFRQDGKLVMTHPTRRDFEATVFSRQDRDATYAEALDNANLDPATKKKIKEMRSKDQEYYRDSDPCPVVIGELFLTTGQSAVRYTEVQTGPHLEACGDDGDPYLNDLSVIKLRKEIADDFDNVFPTTSPIPRPFAADYDEFRANPVIRGMADFDPAAEELLIKCSRSTGLGLGKVAPKRKQHYVNTTEMDATSDYCVYPVQAGTAVGYYGDSGTGLYNKLGMLVAFLLAGNDNVNVETPVYILPVQLAQAQLRTMGYELEICPAGTKAQTAPSSKAQEKAASKKTMGTRRGKQAHEAAMKMELEAQKKRQADEEEIARQAAPDATGCVVIGHGVNGAGPEKKYLVRLASDGKEKWFPRSLLGRSWQPVIDAFCANIGTVDNAEQETGADVSTLNLGGQGKGKKEKN